MEVKKGKANLFALAQEASAETKVTVEKKAKAQLAPIVAVIAEKKAPAGASTSVKAENQMLASAQRAKLSDELQQKLGPGTELYAQAKPTDYARLKNAGSGGARVLSDPSNAIDESRGRKSRPLKPLVISTGSGNDEVYIKMEKGRVYVNVNGKVAWSGTPEEFKRRKVTIDTGAGNDTVTNYYIDGARIQTGKGLDTVYNYGDKTRIDTGDGDDEVYLGTRQDPADGNVINTGSGNDKVVYVGSNNTISTGDGHDTVVCDKNLNEYGQGNIIYTGSGDDRVFYSNDAVIDPDECYDPDKS